MNTTNIRKLPKSVQSLISASNQINTYTKALQEFVYNALDAEATSIAIRIHIREGSLQVADNGCGILQADFKYLGRNHMTSKLVDISTLKSTPNKYGFQGQSLANLIKLSEILKVTSRFHKYETTCVKTFENGKTKSTAQCSPRPSKGTTIEIKGFLYNLSIQNKSVDPINELQNIKTFLEHISLVHSNISLSLRDDSKNEIVYKIHKNRDIYQTLLNLYEIERANLQELQVEKNEYKVKAYVIKRDEEIEKKLIFLNGKYINDSSLIHKKVNDNFKRHLKGCNKKTKKNLNYDDENWELFGNKIPCYFIFITCPYIDYEMTNTVLEFKDWAHINKIIEKLVNFYHGEIQDNTKKQISRLGKKHVTESTTNHIEKIMQKILGHHRERPGISQMQNGIKGKLIKRKFNNKKSSLKVMDSKKNNKLQEASKQDSCHKIIQKTILKKRLKSTRNKQKKISDTALVNTLVDKPIKTNLISKLNSNNTIKTCKQLSKKSVNNETKQIYKPCVPKLSLNNIFAMETESVKRRCEILAQKTEELVQNNKKNPGIFINESVQYTHRNFIKNHEDMKIRTRVNEVVIHEYIPKSQFDNKITKYDKSKLFKSNYDLLQTIISSQKENNNAGHWTNAQNNLIQENKIPLKPHVQKIKEPWFKSSLFDIYRVPLIRERNEPTPCHEEIPGRKQDNVWVPSIQKNTYDANLNTNTKKYQESNDMAFLQARLHRDRMHVKKSDKRNIIIQGDISDYNESQRAQKTMHTDTPNSNIRPYLIRASDDTSSLQVDTFQSHNYTKEFQIKNNVERCFDLDKKPRNYITTKSRENFFECLQNNRFTTNKVNNVNMYSKLFKSKHYKNKKKLNKSTKMFDIENNTVKGMRESYTIECTERNEYECIFRENNKSSYKLCSTDKTNSGTREGLLSPLNNRCDGSHYYQSAPQSPKIWLISKINNIREGNHGYESLNRDTYTITNSYRDTPQVLATSNHENCIYSATHSIEITNKLSYINEKSQTSQYPELQEKNNSNLLCISKSQENDNERQIVEPFEVCETVLRDQDLSMDREFYISFNCEADLNNNFNSNVSNKLNDNINLPQNHEKDNASELINQDELIETSHHFKIPNSVIISKSLEIQSPTLFRKHDLILNAERKEKLCSNDHIIRNGQTEDVTMVGKIINNNDTLAFSIKNRMCLMPKGMSPIFERCKTKRDCDYGGSKEDYYTDELYNDFVYKVQNDTEIFKPRIQEARGLTNKDISKVSNKQNNDNASLKFDGLCIKNATVLGQIDSKFIAAIMKSKSQKSEDHQEFLVLFDQHAVHERIRLENNLAGEFTRTMLQRVENITRIKFKLSYPTKDYLTESQWKSVNIDEVFLKMSRDDILYLHNYRDKFTHFGLQWKILNYNEISITAIPEGILGKNPRRVDKIIKAVKNLIREEISIIQMQRGCVSLHPKSIMELVFSEACRYAIKFGDHLSKSQCIELLSGLSNCKTPFQCAHGRPAMAVIMNVEPNQASYKIDFKMLKQFKNF